MKVGEVVLSAHEIAGLEARLDRCSEEDLAAKNHAAHEAWYAGFCARERQVQENRRKPQSRVEAKFEGAVRNRRHRPGTIGDMLANKVR